MVGFLTASHLQEELSPIEIGVRRAEFLHHFLLFPPGVVVRFGCLGHTCRALLLPQHRLCRHKVGPLILY